MEEVNLCGTPQWSDYSVATMTAYFDDGNVFKNKKAAADFASIFSSLIDYLRKDMCRRLTLFRPGGTLCAPSP